MLPFENTENAGENQEKLLSILAESDYSFLTNESLDPESDRIILSLLTVVDGDRYGFEVGYDPEKMSDDKMQSVVFDQIRRVVSDVEQEIVSDGGD